MEKIFIVNNALADATIKVVSEYAPVFRCEKGIGIFRISFLENNVVVEKLEENGILCSGILF